MIPELREVLKHLEIPSGIGLLELSAEDAKEQKDTIDAMTKQLSEWLAGSRAFGPTTISPETHALYCRSVAEILLGFKNLTPPRIIAENLSKLLSCYELIWLSETMNNGKLLDAAMAVGKTFGVIDEAVAKIRGIDNKKSENADCN